MVASVPAWHSWCQHSTLLVQMLTVLLGHPGSTCSPPAPPGSVWHPGPSPPLGEARGQGFDLGVHSQPLLPIALSPPLCPSLTPSDVQGTEAEQAALLLAARLGWIWAQLLSCPAPSVVGVGVECLQPIHLHTPPAASPRSAIPVDCADGGGEVVLKPQEEVFYQVADAGLLPALGEQGKGWDGLL